MVYYIWVLRYLKRQWDMLQFLLVKCFQHICKTFILICIFDHYEVDWKHATSNVSMISHYTNICSISKGLKSIWDASPYGSSASLHFHISNYLLTILNSLHVTDPSYENLRHTGKTLLSFSVSLLYPRLTKPPKKRYWPAPLFLPLSTTYDISSRISHHTRSSPIPF